MKIESFGISKNKNIEVKKAIYSQKAAGAKMKFYKKKAANTAFVWNSGRERRIDPLLPCGIERIFFKIKYPLEYAERSGKGKVNVLFDALGI